MRDAIEVLITDRDPQAKYVLETYLTIAGYPFRFVNQFRDPTLKLTCGGSEPDDSHVHIPLYDEPSANSVTRVDVLPVVHGPNGPPDFPWINGIAQFDLIRFPFRLLARSEETDSPGRRFHAYETELYDLDLVRTPILNYYATSVDSAIERALERTDRELPEVPRWPGDADFAVVLSHDVDLVAAKSFMKALWRIRTALACSSVSRSDRFKSLLLAGEQAAFTLKHLRSDDPAWNFERWLGMEAEHGFRSTFFFAALECRRTQDPTYKLRDTLRFEGETVTVGELSRMLESKGWEVGLHGSLGTPTDAAALGTQRNRLAAVTSSSVDGTRQHHLAFEYPGTWRTHEDCGFDYDSTLGFNRRLGYRAGIAFPYRPYDVGANRRFDLLELPITIQDTAPLAFEYAGVERALDRCLNVLDEVEATGGLATLLWHPYTQHHPHWPEPMSVYESLLEDLADRDAYVDTGRNVATWWRRREQWLIGNRDDPPAAGEFRGE